MPVVQLQNDTGANIGTALGAVGGYLATKKQRDADKAAATARQTATDARTDRAAQDTHDKITSDIAAQQATSSRDTTTEANTQFQTGAYGKLSTMLHNRPKGVTAQQWVAQVQSQVPTLGLTDPKLLGQLYGEAQGIVKDDQTQNAASFAGHEQTLPTDPKQRLSVLMKRLQAERGVPGLDTKPTQDLITDTQKQITDAEARAYQAQTLAERAHHDSVVENRPHGGGGKPPSAQEQYFITHGYSAPTYSEANPKPAKDADLAGQVTSLRELYSAHQYQNPHETPDQTAAWVKSQGFPPAAIMQVAPAFAGGGAAPTNNGGGAPPAAPQRRHITNGPHKGGIAESTDGGKTWHLSQ